MSEQICRLRRPAKPGQEVVLEADRRQKVLQDGQHHRTRAQRHRPAASPEGEFVSIIGPSGSGKSTLMNLTGAWTVPSEGKIFVDSLDVSKMKDSQLTDIRCKKIGYIFQKFYLLPFLRRWRTWNCRPSSQASGTCRKKVVWSTGDRRAGTSAEPSANRTFRRTSSSAWPSPGRSSNPRSSCSQMSRPGNLDTVTGDEVMAALDRAKRTRHDHPPGHP